MKDYLIIIGAIILGYLVIGCLDIIRTKKIINSNVPLTVKDAYNILYDIVKNCVLEMNQTVVDELKKSDEFDEETQIACKNTVIENVKGYLSDELTELFEKYLGKGQLESYIGSIIESVLSSEKKNNVTTLEAIESSDSIDKGFYVGSMYATYANGEVTDTLSEEDKEYLKKYLDGYFDEHSVSTEELESVVEEDDTDKDDKKE